jgi:hypothetical protein
MAQQSLGHDTAAVGEAKINAMFTENYAAIAALQSAITTIQGKQTTDESAITMIQGKQTTDEAAITALAAQQTIDEATMTAFQTDLDRLAGQKGGVLITDTNAHTGNFMAIAALDVDAVISAMTLASGWTGSMVGQIIPAGTSIVIGFTSVTLSSGSAIAYSN